MHMHTQSGEYYEEINAIKSGNGEPHMNLSSGGIERL